jgi:hypothetical protein
MMWFPCARHLGYRPIEDELVRRKTSAAVDQAVRYFSPEWWKSLGPEDFEREGILEHANMYAAGNPLCDKMHPQRKLEWYEPFTAGLFHCGLAGRFMDIERIATWFDDPSIEPEYTAGTLEDEYQLMFIYIGSRLNPNSSGGFDALLERVKKCRLKRPRLLCALWESIERHDQRAFDKALCDNLNRFLAKPDVGQCYAYVDTHSSALSMIAQHRGLTLPDLTPVQRAALVTPESAGMVEST